MDGADVFALARRFRNDRRTFAGAGNPRVAQLIEARAAFGIRDIAQRVKKLVPANRHSVLPRAFELREDALRLLVPLGLALDAQPSFARGHTHIEPCFELLEQREIVREKRREHARALELQRLGFAHGGGEKLRVEC